MFHENSKTPPAVHSKFYLHATRGNITVLRFVRTEQDAADTARGLAEWAGSRDFVKVKVAA